MHVHMYTYRGNTVLLRVLVPPRELIRDCVTRSMTHETGSTTGPVRRSVYYTADRAGSSSTTLNIVTHPR
jgi:hypothetical protein